MNNVLWLVSWYPNRMDASDGDFIERHALAVSRFAKLTVLFVVKDETLKNNTVEIEKTVSVNLSVYKVYYGRSGWGGVFEKLLSLRKYAWLQKKIYRKIVAEIGYPDIVHVQVTMKAGMLARWLKKKYHIPFVVTEHWTGYDPQSVPNLYNSNRLFKMLNKKILEDAAMFLPVSDALGKMVSHHFTRIPYKVIPNTVDTGLFYYRPSAVNRFGFIHPSYMGYQKNPEGILAACKIVKEKGYDFELLMLGNKDEKLVSLSCAYGLQEAVVFEAAVPYAEVAKRMQGSSALLLFSRFENLPCVVLEALCCGLPVISSRVGGIAEVIDEQNGILVNNENAEQLAGAMIKMMKVYSEFDRQAISAGAMARFNYGQVGREVMGVYSSVGLHK